MLKLVLKNKEVFIFDDTHWSTERSNSLQIYRKVPEKVYTKRITITKKPFKLEKTSIENSERTDEKNIDVMWVPMENVLYLNEDYQGEKNAKRRKT